MENMVLISMKEYNELLKIKEECEELRDFKKLIEIAEREGVFKIPDTASSRGWINGDSGGILQC